MVEKSESELTMRHPGRHNWWQLEHGPESRGKTGWAYRSGSHLHGGDSWSYQLGVTAES